MWDFADVEDVPRVRGSDDGEFRLSYSGSTTLLSCEQKFVNSRILHLPQDVDATDSPALAFGSAFHWVCEQTLHERTPEVPALTLKAIELYDLEKRDYHKLAASLTVYFKLHKASGLVVVACEVEVRDPGYYLGYVDAVMVAPDGGWWICDLKTASQAMWTTFRKLESDPQLCLYASYKTKVASLVGLDPDLFQGCIYRTTVKPKLVPRDGETVREYLDRSNVTSFSIYVRAADLQVAPTRATFDRLYARAAELKAGAEPIRDFSACGDWNRPCEYWSRCHGTLYSETIVPYMHEAGMGKEAPPSILPPTTWDF
jgi:hypothetical protein